MSQSRMEGDGAQYLTRFLSYFPPRSSQNSMFLPAFGVGRGGGDKANHLKALLYANEMANNANGGRGGEREGAGWKETPKKFSSARFRTLCPNTICNQISPEQKTVQTIGRDISTASGAGAKRQACAAAAVENDASRTCEE